MQSSINKFPLLEFNNRGKQIIKIHPRNKQNEQKNTWSLYCYQFHRLFNNSPPTRQLVQDIEKKYVWYKNYDNNTSKIVKK